MLFLLILAISQCALKNHSFKEFANKCRELGHLPVVYHDNISGYGTRFCINKASIVEIE